MRNNHHLTINYAIPTSDVTAGMRSNGYYFRPDWIDPWTLFYRKGDLSTLINSNGKTINLVSDDLDTIMLLHLKFGGLLS